MPIYRITGEDGYTAERREIVVAAETELDALRHARMQNLLDAEAEADGSDDARVAAEVAVAPSPSKPMSLLHQPVIALGYAGLCVLFVGIAIPMVLIGIFLLSELIASAGP